MMLASRTILIGIILVCTFLIAVAITPRKDVITGETKINLEEMVPNQFDGWNYEASTSFNIVSPEIKEQLDNVYQSTLTRVYVNSTGEQVMLSIAYGDDQSRQLQLHKPETCYQSQGFEVNRVDDVLFSIGARNFKARRLVAKNGSRVEPITYLMRIGDATVYGGIGQTIKRIQFGLQGKIPDGILIRISTINGNTKSAFETEEKFIKSFFLNVNPNHNLIFFGE